MEESQKSVKNWYNSYVGRQQEFGVNIRHRTIIKKAVENGLKSTSKVLEIGCGIGTLTGLICEKTKEGKVLAADISDESIKKAKELLSSFNNIELKVSDMSDFSVNEKFDFVVLPDVLEHIPIEQHDNLFRVLSEHTHEESKILINLPHPTFIEWLAINKPELMQIIDQPVHSNVLCANAYKHNFILHSLDSYGLYQIEPDYQWIVFKKNVPYASIEKKSKWILKRDDIKSKL